MLQAYNHKIKTAQELRDLVGEHPHKRSVIMCHGTFDIVHPGHVRHLLAAKGKADILIASLTADIHVTKRAGAPHVPQELRAMNLAAFEAVDYVLIDTNAEPLGNLHTIQPDYFAKGFEYADGATAKTQREFEVLQSYGGEFVFTPGDVVYSSSHLLAQDAPDLKLAKLEALMTRSGLDFDLLHAVLNGMAHVPVHVVGDTIVDSYSYCTMLGSQAKTPTHSVLFDRRIDFVGGAGVVAKHLAAAGGDVTFTTVLGGDRNGMFAVEDLSAAGISVEPITDKTRPTPNKNAFVVQGHRLLKVDILDNSPITDRALSDMQDNLQCVAASAVVFSDFRHGIFNQHTIPTLVGSIPRDALRVADSQVASRWGNILDFPYFDLITPNEREARFALGDQDTALRPMASRLYDKTHCGILMLKLGERGLYVCTSADHVALDSFFTIDSFADHVVDAVGAGDALLAYATLALIVDKRPAVGAILGTLAAAIECGHDGNIPVAVDDMHARLEQVEGAMR